MNTYGISSINVATFNPLHRRDDIQYPREVRKSIVTVLRINNLIFNVLGYTKYLSPISGCVRMGIGVIIIGVTVVVGDPEASQGEIVGRFYKEALLTGITQIARGALEALVPFGGLVNLSLDIIATPFNISRSFKYDFKKRCQNSCLTQYTKIIDPSGEKIKGVGYHPHKEPNYPHIFSLLYLV